MGKKAKAKIKTDDGKMRPRFLCPLRGHLWVSEHETSCIICDVVGEPLNEGAEKLIRRLEEGKSINHVMLDAV